MDLHPALIAGNGKTHLTANAEKTLCQKQVVDLPTRATTYCWECIDKEFDLGKTYNLK